MADTSMRVLLDALRESRALQAETREDVRALRGELASLREALAAKTLRARVAWIGAGGVLAAALATSVGAGWRYYVSGECRDQAGVVAEAKCMRALADARGLARREGSEAGAVAGRTEAIAALARHGIIVSDVIVSAGR